MSVDLSPIVKFKNNKQLSSLYDVLSKMNSAATKINPTTVSKLPPINTTIQGTISLVTDSSVNTPGSIVAGGGNYTVLVWHNGQNWTVLGT